MHLNKDQEPVRDPTQGTAAQGASCPNVWHICSGILQQCEFTRGVQVYMLGAEAGRAAAEAAIAKMQQESDGARLVHTD